MSQKYHINANGDAKPCSATHGGCPFGGESNHFNTAEEARQEYENSMEGSNTTCVKKSVSDPNQRGEVTEYSNDDSDLNEQDIESALNMIEGIETDYQQVDVKDCAYCSGTGGVNEYSSSPTCDACNGHGKVPMDEEQMWDLNNKITELYYIVPEDAEKLSTRIHEHMRGLGIGWHMEYCFVGMDNKYHLEYPL